MNFIFTNFIALCINAYITVWRRNNSGTWYLIVYLRLNTIKQQVDRKVGNLYKGGVLYIRWVLINIEKSSASETVHVSEIRGAAVGCLTSSDCTEGFQANVLQIKIVVIDNL
jgi:hypothetical protein